MAKQNSPRTPETPWSLTSSVSARPKRDLNDLQDWVSRAKEALNKERATTEDELFRKLYSAHKLKWLERILKEPEKERAKSLELYLAACWREVQGTTLEYTLKSLNYFSKLSAKIAQGLADQSFGIRSRSFLMPESVKAKPVSISDVVPNFYEFRLALMSLSPEECKVACEVFKKNIQFQILPSEGNRVTAKIFGKDLSFSSVEKFQEWFVKDLSEEKKTIILDEVKKCETNELEFSKKETLIKNLKLDDKAFWSEKCKASGGTLYEGVKVPSKVARLMEYTKTHANSELSYEKFVEGLDKIRNSGVSWASFFGGLRHDTTKKLYDKNTTLENVVMDSSKKTTPKK